MIGGPANKAAARSEREEVQRQLRTAQQEGKILRKNSKIV